MVAAEQLVRTADIAGNWIDCTVARLEHRLGRTQTAVAIGLVAWLLSLMLASPVLWVFEVHPGWYSRWDVLAEQARDPLFRPADEAYLAYRILVPVLAYGLGLRGHEAQLLICAANILSLAGVFLLLRRNVCPASAALCTGSLGLSVMAQASNYDLGQPDAVSNLLLVGLMWSGGMWTWAVVPFLGLLNDERILLGLPLVFLFHITPGVSLHNQAGAIATRVALAGLGVALALMVRHGITVAGPGPALTGPIYPTIWPFYSGPSFQWAIAALFSFRGLWLLPATHVWLTIKNAPRVSDWRLIAATLYLTVVWAAATSILDGWRSMGQGFPAFVLLASHARTFRPELLRRFLTIVLVVQCVAPCLEVVYVPGGIHWIRPLPIALLELKLHGSVLEKINETWRFRESVVE